MKIFFSSLMASNVASSTDFSATYSINSLNLEARKVRLCVSVWIASRPFRSPWWPNQFHGELQVPEEATNFVLCGTPLDGSKLHHQNLHCSLDSSDDRIRIQTSFVNQIMSLELRGVPYSMPCMICRAWRFSDMLLVSSRPNGDIRSSGIK